MQASIFTVGNLVLLSKFGQTVIIPNPAKIGIVITGPVHHIYECTNSDATIKYCTYDVMFGSELLTDIPEEFLMRMENDDHPSNPQGLDQFFDRGDE